MDSLKGLHHFIVDGAVVVEEISRSLVAKDEVVVYAVSTIRELQAILC